MIKIQLNYLKTHLGFSTFFFFHYNFCHFYPHRVFFGQVHFLPLSFCKLYNWSTKALPFSIRVSRIKTVPLLGAIYFQVASETDKELEISIR